MTPSHIAAPLRIAYRRAKAVLATCPRDWPETEEALRELVRAFEESEHALKALVMKEEP